MIDKKLRTNFLRLLTRYRNAVGAQYFKGTHPPEEHEAIESEMQRAHDRIVQFAEENLLCRDTARADEGFPCAPEPVCTYKAPDGVTDWPGYSFEQMHAFARAHAAQAAERKDECLLLTLDSGFQIPIVRKGDGYVPDPRFPKVQEKPSAPAGVPDEWRNGLELVCRKLRKMQDRDALQLLESMLAATPPTPAGVPALPFDDDVREILGHWLLSHYLTHGKDWLKAAVAQLEAATPSAPKGDKT